MSATTSDVGGLQFVEDVPAPEHFNVMLYGPTGSGKSTAAATAPGPLLWINVEGGNALAFARKTAQERGTRILEVRVDPDKPGDVRQMLREAIKFARENDEPKVQTVVVDTVAKLREALATQLVQPGSRNTQQQWGDVAKALTGFVRVMRDAPVNLILLAHEDILDVEGDRIVRPLIASSGALPESVPSEMDLVAYCGAHRDGDATAYLGQLTEGRGRRAKDRSGGLGTVRPLDLTEWLTAFRAALGAEPVPWDEDYEEPAPEDDPEYEPGFDDLPEEEK